MGSNIYGKSSSRFLTESIRFSDLTSHSLLFSQKWLCAITDYGYSINKDAFFPNIFSNIKPSWKNFTVISVLCTTEILLLTFYSAIIYPSLYPRRVLQSLLFFDAVQGKLQTSSYFPINTSHISFKRVKYLCIVFLWVKVHIKSNAQIFLMPKF